MRDIGPNVRCIPAKRSEDEVFFIRAARGHVLSVNQRRTGTHVGGHRNTEAQVEMLKPSRKDHMDVWLILMHALLCYR